MLSRRLIRTHEPTRSQRGGVSCLDPVEIVDLSTAEARRLRAAADQLAAEPTLSSEDLAEHAAALSAVIPSPLARALHRYGNYGSPHNTLLVRGLVDDLAQLQPTPATVVPPTLDHTARAAALSLLAVVSLLGEPFTFASLFEGRVVQHIVPVPGREHEQTSEGSDAGLAWHVEDAFTGDRCDFFGLLCLRGEPGAATLVSPARAFVLPAATEHVLRRTRFVVEPDTAHGANRSQYLPGGSVLSGPATDPEICYDAIYQRPVDAEDVDAAAALETIGQAIDECAVTHVLEPGQLLIVDNRRVVHGRTHFAPRYDGTDRWLMRAMICASKRAHRRRGAIRALRSPIG